MSDLRHVAAPPQTRREDPGTQRKVLPTMESPNEGTHLSETQIDDFIIGDADTAAASHLATCTLCAGRVAALASDLNSFKDLSTTWSERRSAALPSISRHDPRWQRLTWQRRMVFAVPCLVFLAGIAIIRSGNEPGLTTQPAGGSAAVLDQRDESPTARQSRVSADDRMLDAIDAYVNSDADTPANLGIKTVGSSSESMPASASLQD